MGTSPAPPPFALDDGDARRAGAMALYTKGLLLESTSSEKGDTNAVKEAAMLAFRQALALDPDNRRTLAALATISRTGTGSPRRRPR
jgi:hypothetical protein